MKQCTKCGRWKGVSEFYKCERNGDKSQDWCKKCQKERQENDRKPKKEYDAKRYLGDREGIIERVSGYGKTEKGAAVQRKSKAKYKKSDNGKEADRRYEKTAGCIEHKKKRHLVRAYNITTKDFYQMLEVQGNKCLICKTDKPGKRGFQVDHDHKTGKIRGLLCFRCNVGLGFFVDSVAALKSAIQYLEVLAGTQDARRD